MKRSILCIVFLLVFVGKAFALAPLGSLVPELGQDQWSLGFDYSYSDMDIEISGGGTSATIDVDTNMFFANLGYGLTNEWEAFVRLGVADVETGAFDGDYEFAYGFGTKVNLGNYSGMDWGALFQIGWFEGEDTVAGVDLDFDAYEIQIAVGPTYNAGNYKIYYGPFLHFINGDGDAEIAGLGTGSYDLEEESILGGFVGISTDLTSNSNLSVEYQFTNDAQAVGLRYVHRF